MSDSSTIIFTNPTFDDPALLTTLECSGCEPDWKKVAALIEQDKLFSVKSLSSFAFGCTSAKNAISAVLDASGGDPSQVTAYKLEANTPASMVGNNALIENLVYLTSVCGKLIVQKHLLEKNVHADVVKHISLKGAAFGSVTLTYLFKFPSFEEAVQALDGLCSHARMLYCHARGFAMLPSGRKAPKGKKNNVKQDGEAPELTTYINVDPDFHLTGYVKPGKRGASYADFNRTEDAEAVYSISGTCVRVEVMLSRKWLEPHRLLKPESWKGVRGTNAYKQVLEELRRRLRVVERLRRNVPQQRHLEVLSPMAKTVLMAHLSGQNVWQLPQMTPNRGSNAVTVYQEILSKLHIDMDIPWAEQGGKADPKLGDWLCWDNQYKVPADIAHLCMVRSTLKAKIVLLKAEVKKLMAQVSAQQAISRTRTKASRSAVKKGKLLPMVKREWRERRFGEQDDDATETSDISDPEQVKIVVA